MRNLLIRERIHNIFLVVSPLEYTCNPFNIWLLISMSSVCLLSFFDEIFCGIQAVSRSILHCRFAQYSRLKCSSCGFMHLAFHSFIQSKHIDLIKRKCLLFDNILTFFIFYVSYAEITNKRKFITKNDTVIIGAQVVLALAQAIPFSR